MYCSGHDGHEYSMHNSTPFNAEARGGKKIVHTCIYSTLYTQRSLNK